MYPENDHKIHFTIGPEMFLLVLMIVVGVGVYWLLGIDKRQMRYEASTLGLSGYSSQQETNRGCAPWGNMLDKASDGCDLNIVYTYDNMSQKEDVIKTLKDKGWSLPVEQDGLYQKLIPTGKFCASIEQKGQGFMFKFNSTADKTCTSVVFENNI